ncbi:hypothetical protein [Paraburkholderia nodosa]|uniref:hypothetical protein n=1 Tax=Paraburkholderia nodosa TaxID=392320 RepID=UPI00159F0E90|nr:hypothetical protein [Paraburkholderia nodosa]
MFHTMVYFPFVVCSIASHRANRHPLSGFPLQIRNAAKMRGLFLDFQGREMVRGETRIPVGAPQELLPLRAARGERGLAHVTRQGGAS